MEGKHSKNSKKGRTFETLLKMTLTLILPLVYVGCSKSAHINLKDSRDSGLSNVSNAVKDADHPPILFMGSKFIYQDTNLSDGKISKVTMEVKEKKEFEQKQAYWFEVIGKGMSFLIYMI